MKIWSWIYKRPSKKEKQHSMFIWENDSVTYVQYVYYLHFRVCKNLFDNSLYEILMANFGKSYYWMRIQMQFQKLFCPIVLVY